MSSAAFRKHWTEPRIEPLALSDTEILDFLGEHCYGMTYVLGTEVYPPRFNLECEMITTTRGRTLREAAMLAKAKIDLENE